MPKLKTRTAVKKRFKITKTGKIIRGHQCGRHLKAKKRKTRIRRQKEPAMVKGKFAQKIKRMLPYA